MCQLSLSISTLICGFSEQHETTNSTSPLHDPPLQQCILFVYPLNMLMAKALQVLMMKVAPLGRYSTVKKELSCQTLASLSLSFVSLSVSLSVLRSLMFGSPWYSSSQNTSGGISPVSLHVMSGARMQFLVPKCFFFQESRPRA